MTFVHFLEKTNQPKVRSSETWFIASVGEYLQIWFKNFFIKLLLRTFIGKNRPKTAAILDFWVFRVHNIREKKNFPNPQTKYADILKRGLNHDSELLVGWFSQEGKQ